MSIATEARGYEAIRQCLADETTSVKPLSVQVMTKMLGDAVRNETQVRDAVRKYYLQGFISRVRTENGYSYWWKENTSTDKTFFEEVKVPELTMKIPATAIVKPVVTVTKDKIIVEHPSCRVIIDLF